MSTHPHSVVDHRTLPRKKRAPSLRDQAIYGAHRVDGRTQDELAEKYDLSQRRISAIVSRVEKWRADLIPAAEGELDRKQKQRLDRWLEDQRLSGISSRAMRAYDTQPTELTTVRKGERDGKPFHEETTRQLVPNVQFLKVALRAATDLGKLSDKPSLEAYDAQDSHQRLWQAHGLICELRRDAQKRGELTAASNEAAAVLEGINALIGKGKSEGCIVKSASEDDSASPLSCEPEAVYAPPSAWDFEPETSDAAFPPASSETETRDLSSCSNASNCSNAAPVAVLEISPDQPQGPVLNAAPPSPCAAPGAPAPAAAPAQKKSPAVERPLSPAQRRRLHDQKLEQLREARRSGLPIMIAFDPADGPIPRMECHIEDFGYQPSPPPSREENQRQNEEWIARLQACAARNAGPLPK